MKNLISVIVLLLSGILAVYYFIFRSRKVENEEEPMFV